MIEIFAFVSVVCVLQNALAIEFPINMGEKLCTEAGQKIKFDIIICGAGSAGSVLAERLSEETSWNILLLELGGYPNINSSIPILWANLLNSDLDYKYKSEPDSTFFQGLKDGVCSIPRGKMIGGTSGINVAMYLRGTERDFRTWKKLGCDGWDYEDVYPYMLKAENFHDSDRFDNKTHSTDGYLHVSPFKAPDELIGVFGDALSSIGYQRLNDLNVQQTTGYGYADSTSYKGLRCSTASGYLTPSSYRTNLFFAGRTLVKKVIFDETVQPMRAIGVEIENPNGVSCIVKATTEVILSAGAIASPQVLMLSGIGPEDHLKSMNIKVIKNLPVGEGYQDHPCFLGLVLSDRAHREENDIDWESKKLINITFGLFRHGISTMGFTQLMTFMNTDGETDWHDIQLMKMRISKDTMLGTHNGLHKMYNMFGFSDESAELITDINDKSDTIFMIVILSEPNSRGYIRLKSADIKEQPSIVTNLLTDEDDMNRLIKGIKMTRELVESSIIKDYGLQIERLNFQNCAQFTDIADDNYWKCAVKQIATGFYHPGCTVRMGAEDNELVVLTPDLLVKGFENLRVVDASAFPKMVARNPNAAVIMMAEKASDLIKKRHEKFVSYYDGVY